MQAAWGWGSWMPCMPFAIPARHPACQSPCLTHTRQRAAARPRVPHPGWCGRRGGRHLLGLRGRAAAGAGAGGVGFGGVGFGGVRPSMSTSTIRRQRGEPCLSPSTAGVTWQQGSLLPTTTYAHLSPGCSGISSVTSAGSSRSRYSCGANNGCNGCWQTPAVQVQLLAQPGCPRPPPPTSKVQPIGSTTGAFCQVAATSEPLASYTCSHRRVG